MLKVKRFLLFSLGSTSVEACAYMLGASLVSGWEASECFPSKCLRWMWFFQKVKIMGDPSIFLHLELGVTNQHPRHPQLRCGSLSSHLPLQYLGFTKLKFPMSNHRHKKRWSARYLYMLDKVGVAVSNLDFWTFPLGIWWIWCSRKLPLATDEIFIFYFFSKFTKMSLYVPLQNYQDMNSTCVTSVTPSCWQVSKSDPQLF